MLEQLTLGLVLLLVCGAAYGFWRFRLTPSLFTINNDLNKLNVWKTSMETRFSDHLLAYNKFQSSTFENFDEINKSLNKINAAISRVDEQYIWFKKEWKNQLDVFENVERHFGEQGRLIGKILTKLGEKDVKP